LRGCMASRHQTGAPPRAKSAAVIIMEPIFSSIATVAGSWCFTKRQRCLKRKLKNCRGGQNRLRQWLRVLRAREPFCAGVMLHDDPLAESVPQSGSPRRSGWTRCGAVSALLFSVLCSAIASSARLLAGSRNLCASERHFSAFARYRHASFPTAQFRNELLGFKTCRVVARRATRPRSCHHSFRPDRPKRTRLAPW
jgi:hypothetical protein